MKSRRTYRALGWLLPLAGVFACGNALAIDCGKARTAVEHALCNEPALAKRDADVTALYREVQKSTIGKVRKALVTQQKTWLAMRDKACPSGESTCLEGAYSVRRDQLNALIATANALDDRLENVTPIFIRGTWRVGKIEGDEAPAETKDWLIFHGLPVEGQTFTASPGQLCLGDEACDRVGWWETTVGKLEGGERIAQDLKLSSATKAYEGSTGSPRSNLVIFAGPGRSLMAIIALCRPNAEDCRNGVAPWIPVSHDARIEIGTGTSPPSK